MEPRSHGPRVFSPKKPFVHEPSEAAWTRRPRLESVLRLADAGDNAGALAEAVRLHEASPQDPVFAIEAARQFFMSGDTANSMRVLQELASQEENPTALGLLGYCHLEQDELSRALEFFGRALQKLPADAFSQINMQFIKNRVLPAGRAQPVKAAAPPVALATSLPPKGIETFQRAVASWQKYGFTIISVNTRAECGMLKEHFPDVHFCAQERTAKAATGKDHQYLDSLLDVLAAGADEVCAIVNADIMLQGGAESWAEIAARAASGFVFGPRVDVDAPDDRHGRILTPAADWFFFPRDFLHAVPRSEFIIGQPAWDIFFPAWAAACGLTTHYCYSPAALHVRHPQAWKPETNRLSLRYAFEFLQGSYFSLASPNSELQGADDQVYSLYRALWLGVREKSSPLFCRDPLFTGHMAPLDPWFWQTKTGVLTMW